MASLSRRNLWHDHTSGCICSIEKGKGLPQVCGTTGKAASKYHLSSPQYLISCTHLKHRCPSTFIESSLDFLLNCPAGNLFERNTEGLAA
jgi:hypothetical protein